MDTFLHSGIPLILTIAGLVFLFAAIFGNIGSFASLPQSRQPLAGVTGTLLLLCGIGMYLLHVPITNVTATSPVHRFAPTGMSGEDAGDVFMVDAREEWQITGLAVERGAHVRIEVIDGQWTNWKGTALYTQGEGTEYICANTRPSRECVEYLPDAPTGALIGRIGHDVFHIGQSTTVIARANGGLSLAINDTPSGLNDNDGLLTVRVVIESG